MRRSLLLSITLLITFGSGCAFLKRITGTNSADDATVHTGTIDARPAADFVKYLNRQASLLTSLRYDDVSIAIVAPSPNDPKRTENFTLGSSMLVCSKPRNFLMVGGKGLTGDLVHIGSNEQEFWLLTRPPLDQSYVFCSHSDFAGGQAQLPIPFDPNWAMQALGLAQYDPNLLAKVDVDSRTREYVLSFDTVTPQGQPVKKMIVFAADAVGRHQSQIRRHLVLDASGKTIASAEVKEATTVQVGGDRNTREAATFVQVPTRVLLKWPEQRFEMDLKLREPKVNEPMTAEESRRLFTRPTIRGVNPINLAEARFLPNARGTAPQDRP